MVLVCLPIVGLCSHYSCAHSLSAFLMFVINLLHQILLLFPGQTFTFSVGPCCFTISDFNLEAASCAPAFVPFIHTSHDTTLQFYIETYFFRNKWPLDRNQLPAILNSCSRKFMMTQSNVKVTVDSVLNITKVLI